MDDVIVCDSSSSPTSSTDVSKTKSGKLPPCRVCGIKASGFHYGQFTCEGCKGFFKRSIRRKEPYKCTGKEGEKCDIGPTVRRLCPKCRHDKCQGLGMSKTAVKAGRYTSAKKTVITLAVKNPHREGSTNDESSTFSSVQLSERGKDKAGVDQTPAFNLEELIKTVVQAHDTCIMDVWTPEKNVKGLQDRCLEEHQLRQELFGPRPLLPKEQYEEFYKTTGIDIDGRQELMKEMLEGMETYLHRYISFVKNLPEFMDLPVVDQANLVKFSSTEYYLLDCFLGFSKEQKVVVFPDGTGYHMEELKKVYDLDFIDADFKISESLKELNLEHEEAVILLAICVFFTDRCELQEPKKVEEIQWKLVQCLMHLLEKNHTGDKTLFARIIDRLTRIREYTYIARKMDREMLLWPQAGKFPLSTEIMNGRH